MNVDKSMCAPSGQAQHWDQIGWNQCQRQVKRLQARIVKATREGPWGKVKSLQWLLTHSFSGKALAVKRVTENRGKRTAGVDHVRWLTPAAKLKAIDSLRHRGYRPLPLRRVYIPKANGTALKTTPPLPAWNLSQPVTPSADQMRATPTQHLKTVPPRAPSGTIRRASSNMFTGRDTRSTVERNTTPCSAGATRNAPYIIKSRYRRPSPLPSPSRRTRRGTGCRKGSAGSRTITWNALKSPCWSSEKCARSGRNQVKLSGA
jgi:hypothetical protein